MAWIDENYDEGMAAHDAKVEAYGDRCPGCGTLRWGADCPKCYHAEEFQPLPLGFYPLQAEFYRTPEQVREFSDDDIAF